MKLGPIVEVVAANLFLLALLAWVTADYASRLAYWVPESFTPKMVRYPFFYITSATNGASYIPGLLTVDWQQVILALLVLVDAVFVLSALREKTTSVLP